MKLRFIALLFLSTVACKQEKKTSEKKVIVHAVRPADVHSFSTPKKAKVNHLNLKLNVDFETKMVSGVAVWDIKADKSAENIIFDSNGLLIDSVKVDDSLAKFTLGHEEKYKGRPLEVEITPTSKKVTIWYKTSPEAEALQWLSPQQTTDKKSPFLYTQSETILARTWIPCQDSPAIRFTYDAEVIVPSNLLALMSASNPIQKNSSGHYTFSQKNPISSYLMALAVGDLEFRSLGKNTGVYSEKSMIKKCAWEFAGLPKMMTTAEQLYGPYKWGRYDVLVLPASFPFGGMENPELTFATPTIIAGDRSLVTVVAHELAHSWSGNLVTNASWNDMWLNEGFTVYFERRIMERMEGKDYADMLAVLGFQELQSTLTDLGPSNPDAKLKLNLKDRNPDDATGDIAYEKGFCLLKTIENVVGRPRFDAFLNQYFKSHAFQTISTEEFIDYYYKELIKNDKALAEKIGIEKWVFEPGLPANCPKFTSIRFNNVDSALNQWINGKPAKALPFKNWSSHELLHFVRHLPNTLSIDQMKELDKALGLTKTGNSEVLTAWLTLAINNHYVDAYPSLNNFLTHVGRRRFLLPLYKAMATTEEGKKIAKDIYLKARPNYHFVSQQSIDELLK
ncbi:M1 family metallopeptidase [Solitalea sp. MAHUQ-68]|uniref:Aminopeptidase N n=1 Tax=Solitalea agri TaxID=2953739 RepID=A0A9X2JBR2_9SPHI|nr:M1 family metallopeptidase [Solitalea agri]MCO4292747.1 M1 family metallopeptidase [Solitalea agri]